MPSYPLPTLAPTVGLTGILIPAYSDIYASFQATFSSIYGGDAYIDPDSQDGQLLAAIAQAVADSNAAAVAIYNSFSPVTSQGAALSSNVKLNGIARGIPSYGQVNLTIVGPVGTTILNGIASDSLNNQWALPASVTIPPAGFIIVTATAVALGEIPAAIGAITTIVNPQLGWQSVTNASVATPGNAIETDAALRQRQTVSTELPSATILDGIVGAVDACAGVTQVRAYENDTGSVDINGMPAHSMGIMVIGGATTDIANAIMLKKTPGSPTFGSTAVNVTSPSGIPMTINYTVPAPMTVTAALTIKALSGYTTGITANIQTALANYINATLIGGGIAGVVEWDNAITAIKSVANSNTFKVVSLVLTGPGGAGTPDVPVPFNQVAAATTAGMVVTVT